MDLFCKTPRHCSHVPGTAKAPAGRFLNRTIAFILIGLRPLLGQTTCLYEESCGAYTTRMLNTKPLLPAFWHSTKRIVSCNPFTRR